MDIAWWSPSPGIVWHFEVRDGLLVMKMSSMLFPLVGVVTICSVWVVRSMSRKKNSYYTHNFGNLVCDLPSVSFMYRIHV